ncbi:MULTISPECIES: hypothetical protein [unclassified Tatumella]|uniref:hypothetical protein n=1 Tax=unclassified Tatumella TaxID=2649542 RepID=UPI001BB0A44A|nr:MULTISPECIES: hypothetical protein [unclassified Tatumella]MBS0856711.1 hypothetical protein [Tatumella sp. JGM16]MBS0912925.1 hypothetical protein [Tatumella sp. JGM91]
MPTTENSSCFVFSEYQPDPEDICTLCGANAGRDRLVTARNNLLICEDCIDVLSAIKVDRISKRNQMAISELLGIEGKMPDTYSPYEFVSAIVENIRAGKIPSLKFHF